MGILCIENKMTNTTFSIDQMKESGASITVTIFYAQLVIMDIGLLSKVVDFQSYHQKLAGNMVTRKLILRMRMVCGLYHTGK